VAAVFAVHEGAPLVDRGGASSDKAVVDCATTGRSGSGVQAIVGVAGRGRLCWMGLSRRRNPRSPQLTTSWSGTDGTSPGAATNPTEASPQDPCEGHLQHAGKQPQRP
jgi:hypothetical protein